MTKALIVLLLAVATVLMPSCAKPGKTEDLVEAGEAVSVRTAEVQLASIPDVFEVPGTVRATSTTTLSSKDYAGFWIIPTSKLWASSITGVPCFVPPKRSDLTLSSRT